LKDLEHYWESIERRVGRAIGFFGISAQQQGDITQIERSLIVVYIRLIFLALGSKFNVQ